jgi:hypothetical protein
MPRITDEGQYIGDAFLASPPKRKETRLTAILVTLILIAVLSLAWAVLGAISRAHAHDAKNPQWNNWLMAQKNQEDGICCNETDTFVLGDNEWRVVNAHYEVLHNGAWMEVPASALTKSKENPTNGALLWVWNGKVQCFKPGTFY